MKKQTKAERQAIEILINHMIKTSFYNRPKGHKTTHMKIDPNEQQEQETEEATESATETVGEPVGEVAE